MKLAPITQYSLSIRVISAVLYSMERCQISTSIVWMGSMSVLYTGRGRENKNKNKNVHGQMLNVQRSAFDVKCSRRRVSSVTGALLRKACSSVLMRLTHRSQ